MLTPLVCLFFLTIVFIFLLRSFALELKMIDRPNARSIHKKETARGAGIAFFFAITLTLLFWNAEWFTLHPWSSLAIFFVFLVGVFDDIKGSSPKLKFLFIIVGTLLLSLENIMIRDFGNFFSWHLTLGYLAYPLTIFVVSGFTNALNLIDGLDGLSASLSLVMLSSFLFIGFTHHDMFMVWISLLFMTTLLAFLLFNWHPASIFMGDSGSLLLGFVISLLAIVSLAYIPPVSILFLAAVPLLDTLVVMIRRKKAGNSFFQADACHIHHILKQYFHHSVPKTVLTLVGVQLFYTFIGLQLMKGMDQGVLFIGFVIHILLLYLFVNKMIKKLNMPCVQH